MVKLILNPQCITLIKITLTKLLLLIKNNKLTAIH